MAAGGCALMLLEASASSKNNMFPIAVYFRGEYELVWYHNMLPRCPAACTNKISKNVKASSILSVSLHFNRPNL
jgi:hypothetical protein